MDLKPITGRWYVFCLSVAFAIMLLIFSWPKQHDFNRVVLASREDNTGGRFRHFLMDLVFPEPKKGIRAVKKKKSRKMDLPKNKQQKHFSRVPFGAMEQCFFGARC